MTVTTVAVDREQVLAIVQEVFAAMLDAGEQLVTVHPEPTLTFAAPVSAHVDMSAATDQGELNARALLCTESDTAHEIARELLMLTPDDPVTTEDLIDAFGEIANVVGGNVKALINAPAKLSLPQVAHGETATPNALFIQDLNLAWRGRGLSVSLWLLG